MGTVNRLLMAARGFGGGIIVPSKQIGRLEGRPGG